jgi:hypothetical protein
MKANASMSYVIYHKFYQYNMLYNISEDVIF